MDCRQALEANGSDVDRALAWLRERHVAAATRRKQRATPNGLVTSYLHSTGDYPVLIGVLLELNCESDFVAKTDRFRELARELAMQVAATSPRWSIIELVPPDIVRERRESALLDARAEGRPERVWQQVVDGRLRKFYESTVLYEQIWIRDSTKKVGDLVKEHIATLQENIVVRRFCRFDVRSDGQQ